MDHPPPPPPPLPCDSSDEAVESVQDCFEVRCQLSDPGTDLSSTSESGLCAAGGQSDGESADAFSEGPPAVPPPQDGLFVVDDGASRQSRSLARSAAQSARRNARSAARMSVATETGKRALQLECTLPEEFMLDSTRLDIDKVMQAQEEFRGAFMPHFMSWAFDEGCATAVPPASAVASAAPVGTVTTSFVNLSQRKTGGACRRYLIHIVAGREDRVLDCGTCTCTSDGKVLGRVVCVFGPVSTPHYVVQDTTGMQEVAGEEVQSMADLPPIEPRVAAGDAVHTLEGTERVLHDGPAGPDALKKFATKGCDASTYDDEELPPEQHAFSDDEAERAARRSRKRGRAGRKVGDAADGDSCDDSSSGTSYSFDEEGTATRVRCTRQEKKRQRTLRAQGIRRGSRADLARQMPPPEPRPTVLSMEQLSQLGNTQHPIAASAASRAMQFIRSLSDPRKVYVSQVPPALAWHQLAAIAGAAFGPVDDVTCKELKGKQGKADRRIAFITFLSPGSAALACRAGALYTPQGEKMCIKEARPSKFRPRDKGDGDSISMLSTAISAPPPRPPPLPPPPGAEDEEELAL